MKLFMAIRLVKYEGGTLLGVYRDELKAAQRCAEFKAASWYNGSDVSYDVESIESGVPLELWI